MGKKTLLSVLCVLIAAFSARAQDGCAPVDLTDKGQPIEVERLQDYTPVFDSCRGQDGVRLAIRRLVFDGQSFLLTVDPQSLDTQLERAACLSCVETSDEAQETTRLMRVLHADQTSTRPPALVNAGLIHGAGAGVYVTGDLCPSGKPLDRAFIDDIAKHTPGAPITLAISGSWLAHHGADFSWLQEKIRDGAITIDWANHSYSHPYVIGLADRQNYLLRPGVDLDREIFETEKLLIAHGATPSVFFRFPGLVADPSLLEKLRERHLIALGADAWLALGPAPRPGSIVLVHPNGNEPGGLKLFMKYLASGKMPQPFRRINEAP